MLGEGCSSYLRKKRLCAEHLKVNSTLVSVFQTHTVLKQFPIHVLWERNVNVWAEIGNVWERDFGNVPRSLLVVLELMGIKSGIAMGIRREYYGKDATQHAAFRDLTCNRHSDDLQITSSAIRCWPRADDAKLYCIGCSL
jgi:hypothetical protein